MESKILPTYTLYHGTFIQLPRHISKEAPPEFEINTGVLWVLNQTGKIDGFDWNVTLGSSAGEDETVLKTFVQSKGWTLWEDEDGIDSSKETVRIVRGSQGQNNGFFFPGFIGMFCSIGMVIQVERRFLIQLQIHIFMHHNILTRAFSDLLHY